MFPMEDLRQAVEIAKRILTKEKLDRQLTGQTSTSPFMSIRDGINRNVSFNTKDELGDKIDKLTVMLGKLAVKDNNNKRPFKPHIYRSRGPLPQSQNRGYNQRNYQSVNRLGNRSGSGDRRQFGRGNERSRFQQNCRRNNFQESTRGYRRQSSRGEYRNDRHDDYNRSRDRSRERSLSGNYSGSRDRSSSKSRLRSGYRASTNRDRIKCYNCREYDHFASDCPTS